MEGEWVKERVGDKCEMENASRRAFFDGAEVLEGVASGCLF